MHRVVLALLCRGVLIWGTGIPASAQSTDPPSAPAPMPAATSAPPNIQNVTNNNVLALPAMPTPKELAGEVFQGALVLMLGATADALQTIVGGIVGGPSNFVTQTPPAFSYANGHVTTFAAGVRNAALASLALVIGFGGLWIATGRKAGLVYADALELLARAVIGAVLISIFPDLCRWMIDLNNALAAGIGGALPAWNQPITTTPTLTDVLARTAYLLTALVLLLQMATRLVLVDVGLILAPAAWVLWILPQTHGLFSKWATLFVGAVYIQFVQVLALKLGVALVADMGGGPTGIVLGIAVLFFTLKIPAIVQAGYHSNGLATALVLGGAARSAAMATGGALSGGAGIVAGVAARAIGVQRDLSAMPAASPRTGRPTSDPGAPPLAPSTDLSPPPPTPRPAPAAPKPSIYERRVES